MKRNVPISSTDAGDNLSKDAPTTVELNSIKLWLTNRLNHRNSEK